RSMKRRLFLATSFGALSGCGFGNALNDSPLHRMLGSAERLNRAVIGTRGMAKLYRWDDVDRDFRTNGFDPPSDGTYERMLHDGFASYRLVVDGEVERKGSFTLTELRAI